MTAGSRCARLRHALVRLVAAVLLLGPAAVGEAAFPEPRGLVTDAADAIDAPTEAAVLARLQDAERQSGAQIAVATVTSLDGLTIEQYAERLFRTWGIGQKGRDNGVLILVAPRDRQVRIEVGYGLEGVLPDGLAGEIIREQAIPAFRNGDFGGGIEATAARVAAIVIAGHVLTDDERRALQGDADTRPPAFATTAFFSLFIALGALSAGAGLRSRAIFPLLWGGLFGGIPFAMSLIPFFNATLWFLLPLALGAFVLGYRRAGSPEMQQMMRGSGPGTGGAGGRSTGTGWVMGGSRSSSGGGSRSSGSSFGGGRSGGGGASGRW